MIYCKRDEHLGTIFHYIWAITCITLLRNSFYFDCVAISQLIETLSDHPIQSDDAQGSKGLSLTGFEPWTHAVSYTYITSQLVTR